jgi:hypothetical protein
MFEDDDPELHPDETLTLSISATSDCSGVANWIDWF